MPDQVRIQVRENSDDHDWQDVGHKAGDQAVPVSISGVGVPTVYNITLTLANTEYSQLLPDNIKEFRFRCRTLYDVRYAFLIGKVATSISPYITLPAGCDYFSDNNNLSNKTIYFASSQAGVVVELETWS